MAHADQRAVGCKKQCVHESSGKEQSHVHDATALINVRCKVEFSVEYDSEVFHLRGDFDSSFSRAVDVDAGS